MINPPVSNPNDFKVVEFRNSTDFLFTPEMGCMYDGRPIFGISGSLGIQSGETMTLPYHIGHRLATNLAKAVMVRQAPRTDPQGIPTGVPLWNADTIDKLKNTFIKDLYSEQKPIAQSETDKLMAKVEEYRLQVEKLLSKEPGSSTEVKVENANPQNAPLEFKDKQEVIAELTKRGVKFDPRQKKADLLKLLV